MFGSDVPFAEPYWYQGKASPYYNDTHHRFRAVVRRFVEEELRPHTDRWIKEGYPKELHRKAYEAGIQGSLFPPEYGGTALRCIDSDEPFDHFHELILWDELARAGGGMVFAHLQTNSMALPPIIAAGSEAIKEKVIRRVVTGEANVSLAISEPDAGSDMAGLCTTAIQSEDETHWVVNGNKKWITGGHWAEFFLVAARTDEDGGMMGISLFLIERDSPGISVRKMETQFDSSHSTTFVTLEDVKVPSDHMIGPENLGFLQLATNMNHERLVIAISASRSARVCYEEAVRHAMSRKTFGQHLMDHQIIRFKLAEMARSIESLHDNIERVTYQFKSGVPDAHLGAECSLLKVQASKTFEYCAREASQIFGGSSVVKEGRGKVVERLYREVRTTAIPGGSEEVLLDFAMRDVQRKMKKAAKRSKL